MFTEKCSMSDWENAIKFKTVWCLLFHLRHNFHSHGDIRICISLCLHLLSSTIINAILYYVHISNHILSIYEHTTYEGLHCIAYMLQIREISSFFEYVEILLSNRLHNRILIETNSKRKFSLKLIAQCPNVWILHIQELPYNGKPLKMSADYTNTKCMRFVKMFEWF